jgi:hypothetical protein
VRFSSSEAAVTLEQYGLWVRPVRLRAVLPDVFRPPDDAREPVSLPALEQLSSPAGAASGLLPATAADRLGDKAAASELVRIGRIIDHSKK